VSQWVRLCRVKDVPEPGTVREAEVEGVALCVANADGRVAVLDNWCPHRRGPLGQGWMEGDTVVCPWHCWSFSSVTGVAAPPDQGKVQVFAVRVEGEDVLVDLSGNKA
jgi:nitrite reductase (NADH) small subunit